MGVECSIDRKHSYFSELIESKLANKFTPLDKKIHKEYLSSVNLPDKYYMDYFEEETKSESTNYKNDFKVNSKVDPDKKASRFKKWYKIAFLSISKSNSKIVLNYTPKKIFGFSPKKSKNAINFSEKNQTKLFSNTIQAITKSNKTLYSVSVNKNAKSDLASDNCTNKLSSNISDSDIKFYKSFSINQAEVGIKNFMNTNREKFRERIKKGPPESFRWIAWIVEVGFKIDRNENFYNHLLSQNLDLKVEKDIRKDLDRTMRIGGIESALESLRNVLRAFANYDKEVNYCQGMNFLAAFLLIISDFNEVDSLYMMIILFSNQIHMKLGIRGLFLENFPLLGLLEYQFKILFDEKLTNLSNHFVNLDIHYELWVSKWFRTLFTFSLPIDLLVRVWDCLIVIGESFLFSFTLSVLKLWEKELLSFDECDINEYFKNMDNFEKIPVEKIIEDSLSLKIESKFLEKTRKEYESINSVNLDSLKKEFDLELLSSEANISDEDNEKNKGDSNNFELKADLIDKFNQEMEYKNDDDADESESVSEFEYSDTRTVHNVIWNKIPQGSCSNNKKG